MPTPCLEVEHLTPTDLGRILWKENFRSVAHRYPDSDELPGEDIRDLPEEVADITPAGYVSYEHRANLYNSSATFTRKPGLLFKAIDCLDYQSCECDDWRDTQAHKILERLRAIACDKAEGYDSAPWGIDTDMIGSSGNAVLISDIVTHA